MLSTGLLGCGRIAQLVHLDALKTLPGVHLSALAEQNPQRRAEAGQRVPEARLFANYRDALDAPELDAVVVCLPPALHAEAALHAFEAGKHVYLEKPIATNLDEARALLEAGRAAEKVGMIGFNYRFGALQQETKQLLQAGRLGEIAGLRSVFSSASHGLPSWKANRQSGGGVLLDLASHHVDLVRFFFEEEIVEVSAQLRSQQSEADSAAVQLRLESGLLVQSFFSLRAVDEDVFEIYGNRGKLSFDRHASASVEITSAAFEYGRTAQLKRELRQLGHSVRRMLRAPGEPSFKAALGAFAQAAAGQRVRYPDLGDGYQSLAVLTAAEEAAATGQPVAVPQHDGVLL